MARTREQISTQLAQLNVNFTAEFKQDSLDYVADCLATEIENRKKRQVAGILSSFKTSELLTALDVLADKANGVEPAKENDAWFLAESREEPAPQIGTTVGEMKVEMEIDAQVKKIKKKLVKKAKAKGKK